MSEPINNLYTNLDSLLINHGNDTNENALYDIISQKDELIQNLKEANSGLSNIITNFNYNIDRTNRSVSNVLSKICSAF